jgi:hypothetical protein
MPPPERGYWGFFRKNSAEVSPASPGINAKCTNDRAFPCKLSVEFFVPTHLTGGYHKKCGAADWIRHGIIYALKTHVFVSSHGTVSTSFGGRVLI